MTFFEIIQKAIPGASQDECDHILWGRTPFPFKAISAQYLYKKASGYRRANANGLRLCDHCSAVARDGEWECVACDAALRSTRV